MNPILIKPSGERRSQVMVMGKPFADADARSYTALSTSCARWSPARCADLRERSTFVVRRRRQPRRDQPEGRDLVNMRLARAAELPVLLVGGHRPRRRLRLAVRHAGAAPRPADQAQSRALSSTSSAATPRSSQPGLEQLHERPDARRWACCRSWRTCGWTSRTRWRSTRRAPSRRPRGGDTLDVAVIRLRWISNFTDADALGAEPGVRVRFTRSAADVERADLVVVPGTKATVEDLARLRGGRPRPRAQARAAAGDPILGSAAATSCSASESRTRSSLRRGDVAGLGLLPVDHAVRAGKLLRRRMALRVAAHGGRGMRSVTAASSASGGASCSSPTTASPTAASLGGDRHRLARRRSSTTRFAGRCSRVSRAARGRQVRPRCGPFAAARGARLDVLGDLVADHLDTAG